MGTRSAICGRSCFGPRRRPGAGLIQTSHFRSRLRPSVFALIGTVSFRGRPHNRDTALLNFKGTVFRTPAVCVRRFDDEAAVVAFAGTELFLRDLVANGTGDSVGGLAPLGIIGADGKV